MAIRMSGVRMRVACQLGVLVLSGVLAQGQQAPGDAFFELSKDQATRVGANMRRSDNVGSRLSFRGFKTDQAVNYKMRATWLTPDVIRATARLIQLNERLSRDQAVALVSEAESVGDTVFFIEIDPNEGSGVIPSDWAAFLQPKGLTPGNAGAIRGIVDPKLRDVRALAGVFRRDYAYDAFWVVFPLKHESGAPVFTNGIQEAELIVSIRGRDASVSWPIPASIRAKASATP